jgi:two-component system sensor histidine kinase/response regulator
LSGVRIVTKSDSCAQILLAEDNPACQNVALAMLLRLGHKVDTVNNGLKVLEALKRKNYALVLMDIAMPLMDGIAATQEIRRSFPPLEQPWIVAYTAYDLPEVRKRCLETGMDNYMTKPVRLNELQAMLLKYSVETDLE